MTPAGDTNGGRQPWRFNISATTIAAVSATVGAILYVLGFVTGYMAYTRDMTQLLAGNSRIEIRASVVEQKVTEIQGDIKVVNTSIETVKQNIAQLQLFNVPKR